MIGLNQSTVGFSPRRWERWRLDRCKIPWGPAAAAAAGGQAPQSQRRSVYRRSLRGSPAPAPDGSMTVSTSLRWRSTAWKEPVAGVMSAIPTAQVRKPRAPSVHYLGLAVSTRWLASHSINRASGGTDWRQPNRRHSAALERGSHPAAVSREPLPRQINARSAACAGDRGGGGAFTSAPGIALNRVAPRSTAVSSVPLRARRQLGSSAALASGGACCVACASGGCDRAGGCVAAARRSGLEPLFGVAAAATAWDAAAREREAGAASA